MKKILSLGMVLGLALSASALTAQQPPEDPRQDPSRPAPQEMGQQHATSSLRGTIASLDHQAKSFIIRDDSGKEVTVFWNDTTKLNGDLKEGATVSVEARDEGGRMTATSIQVSSKKPSY